MNKRPTEKSISFPAGNSSLEQDYKLRAYSPQLLDMAWWSMYLRSSFLLFYTLCKKIKKKSSRPQLLFFFFAESISILVPHSTFPTYKLEWTFLDLRAVSSLVAITVFSLQVWLFYFSWRLILVRLSCNVKRGRKTNKWVLSTVMPETTAV